MSQTFTWQGSTGSFSDPSHWSPSGVPGAGDTAVIAAAEFSPNTPDVTLSTGALAVQDWTLGYGTLEVVGNTTLTAGTSVTEDTGIYQSVGPTIEVENGATLTSAAAITFQTPAGTPGAGGVGNAPNVIDGGTFENDGTVTLDKGAILRDTTGAFVNNATVAVHSADLYLGSLTGTSGLIALHDDSKGLRSGPFFYANPGTVSIAGTVSAGETIAFAPPPSGVTPGSLLEIGHAQSFAGTIAGFVPGDTIRFDKTAITGVSFQPDGGASGSGTLLVNLAETTPSGSTQTSQAAIHLASTPANPDFTVTADGAGDEDLHVTSGPPSSSNASPDGTTITAAGAGPIVDAQGNDWTLVDGGAKGLQIAVNGTVDPVTANVVLLEYLHGEMVQENSAGSWYAEPGPNGPWSQIADPNAGGSTGGGSGGGNSGGGASGGGASGGSGGTNAGGGSGGTVPVSTGIAELGTVISTEATVSGSPPDLTVTIDARTLAAVGATQIAFLDGTLDFDPSSPAADIVRLYGAALGRAPDAPGLAAWVQQLQSGVALDSIAAGFIDSAEFQARFPGAQGGPTAFVNQLYENVLHRTGSDQEVTGWVTRLQGGMSQGAVLAAFADSPENEAATSGAFASGVWVPDAQAAAVARLYYVALGRAPDAAGLTAWTEAIKSGQLGLQAEAQGFVQSPEFTAIYGTPGNGQFVAELYHNALHRAPDAAGQAAWTGALDSGAMTRGQVAVGFSQSAEEQALLAPVTQTHGIATIG